MDPREILKAIMFGPVQLPGDYVLAALKREIEEYRLSSYHTFDIHVNVYPAPGALHHYGSNGVWVGHSAYQFVQWSGLPTTFNVLVSPSGKPAIKYNGKFRRLTRWLETLEPPTNWFEQPRDAELVADIKQERWAHQFRWWLVNGKHFPLLKLPAEIREIIYGYIFSEWIEPYPKAKVRRLDQSSQAALSKKMNFKLLLTSKQVMHEASNILFSYTPFYVGHSSILRQVTNDPILQFRLRRLTIGFTHEQYLCLFRSCTVSNTGDVEVNKSVSAQAFKFMALDLLRLVVNWPLGPTKECVFAGACQVKFVEWLMESAWPFVRGQMVELGGCVKRRQIAAFKAKCKAFRKGFEMWNRYRATDGKPEGKLVEYLQEVDDEDDEDGGVSLEEPKRNGGKVDEAITAAQSKMHPDFKCECKNRCNPKEWYFDD